MQILSQDYNANVSSLDNALGYGINYDLNKKTVKVGVDFLTMYFINGFVKDNLLQNMINVIYGLTSLGASGEGCAQNFADAHLPNVQVDVTDDLDKLIYSILCGSTVLLGSAFDKYGIIVDARSYPMRNTQEPDNDRVMRGARDGFVENLLTNTALIRRRIRNPALRVCHERVGTAAGNDVAICYIEGKASAKYVDYIKAKLKAVQTDGLPLGHESLAECIIRTRWYNPFPKLRYTERPDMASARLLEGSVIIICDNSPEAMILPTSIFDFLQDTNDYYLPPLTGSYMRIVRQTTFWLTIFLIPLWYLLINNPQYIPPQLEFILPEKEASIPIILQLFIVEFFIDGLKMASMNTPQILSQSLSVVGGLILGEFAVQVGWIIPEVILYMAFVVITNFTQSSYELEYAFKFMRMMLLILSSFFNVIGFVIGVLLIVVIIATNTTANGKRSYLYPLIPFNGKAFVRLIFRVQKDKLQNK